MRKSLFISCLLAIICFISQAQTQAEQPGRTYALVVGIANYENRNIPNLNYSNRDAQLFAEYLRSAAGGSVPGDNIRLLIDTNATTAAVYNSLDWLKTKCEEDKEEFPGAVNTVYFYYSGHGDLESQFFSQLGYLLCYNTPANNYRNNAVRLEDLNDFANKLSVDLDAKVIMITDACHSGKLAGSNNGGTQLVGRALSQARAKEIRISACLPDQLSYEDAAWDGGRGVFSYYLLNGLKGLADKNSDKSITLQEIRSFLETSFSTDATLKKENKKQTPVLKGNQDSRLAIVHPETSVAVQQLTMPAVVQSDRDYFFSLLNKRELLEELDFKILAGLKHEKLFEKLINQLSWLEDSSISMQMLNEFSKVIIDAGGEEVKKIKALDNYKEAGDLINRIRQGIANNSEGVLVFGATHENARNFINKLKDALQVNERKMKGIGELVLSDKEVLQSCMEELVEALHNSGQHVINLYLQGDVAELEKRAYYNTKKSRYEVYPEMYKLALQIVPAEVPLSKILQINQYYFTGLITRMKTTIVSPAEQARLIDKAFEFQQKAMALDSELAFVHNELGILYWAKKNIASARQHFIKATELAPEWAIPWANLGGLAVETKEFEKGIVAGLTADSLQANLHTNAIQQGLLYQKKGNFLVAEEYYRKAVDINSRHFFPFEGLGHVYMAMTRYASADSFFHEAEIRKKGYQFAPNEFGYFAVLAPFHRVLPKPCLFNPDDIKDDDIIGLFNLARRETSFAEAERVYKKILIVDPRNPLASHYLGKLYYRQKKWEAAEILFRFAMDYYLGKELFNTWLDSVNARAKYTYDKTTRECLEGYFKIHHYSWAEDDYFLASVYENWSHFNEAEVVYRHLIEEDPEYTGAYVKLWRQMEAQGRYDEAEQLIRKFESVNVYQKPVEMTAFYKRMMERFPEDGNWPYKLGLYLYDSAFNSTYQYLDTVIFFPLMNKEVYLGLAEYNKIHEDPLMRLDINGNRELNQLTELKELSEGQVELELPGTNEKIVLGNGPVYAIRQTAIHYFSKADSLINEETTRADINYKIGNLYARAGSYKMATPNYERVLSLDPTHIDARMKLAAAYQSNYKNQAALNQLNYLYDSNKINFPQRMILAEFLAHEGKFEKAKKLTTEAQAIYPYEVPASYDLLGRINMLSKKYTTAIINYQRYLKSNPTDPAVHYNIARLYQKSGNKKQAMLWLERSISNGFNYSYVLANDETWTTSRNTPEWKKLMRTLKSKEYN